MKRHNNLYQLITSEENVRAAWKEARRGKSSKSAVRRFERDLDGNLKRIRESLINKTYKTSPYKTMIIKEPKERLIYRLPYDPDRIVHHVLMLLDQCKSYETEIPFLTTVKRIEKYFSFT